MSCYNSLHHVTGGCALAFAVNLAAATVPVDTHRVYSVLGHFLSAAKADRRLRASVAALRDTSGFATRTVIVSQVMDDGTVRSVLSAHVDFHRREPASLLNFSVPPPKRAQAFADSWDHARRYDEMRRLPGCSAGTVRMFEKMFEPAMRFYEQRGVPDSVATQNLYGLLKEAPTTQDDLALTDKATFDWSRSRHPLRAYADHIAALAFHMDGAIAFIPLTHSKMSLADAKACSSLDFALRFFDNDPDFNHWHLREIRTVAGGCGRSYGVSRLFDASGRLVAEMSQQGIMRPFPAEKASL
jgi:acyl-CoA thioesterase II